MAGRNTGMQPTLEDHSGRLQKFEERNTYVHRFATTFPGCTTTPHGHVAIQNKPSQRCLAHR
jgi:hypothetical protein